jgi:hypothetical protein
LAQQRQFGQSSEVSLDQLGLFNETEQTIEEHDLEAEQETISYTRKKPKRKPLPKDLPRDYLDGYQGYPQVDGYAGYAQTEASLVGCFAHARRKFIEVPRAQIKGKTGKADWAISHIRKLYRIESEIKDEDPAEKGVLRQVQAKPLLDQFKAWLDKSALQVPPKSAVGKVIAYSLGQWSKLERYIEVCFWSSHVTSR